MASGVYPQAYSRLSCALVANVSSTAPKTINCLDTEVRGILVFLGRASQRIGMYLIVMLKDAERICIPVLSASQISADTTQSNKITLTSSSTSNAVGYLLLFSDPDNVSIT